MSRSCTASPSGDELLDAAAPARRTGRTRSSTASRRTSAAPCPTTRTSSSSELSRARLRRSGSGGAARRDWRSGKARSLRSPAARQAFEAMLPALLAAIAAGADPDRALNRLSDIVERLSSGVNFFRLLEARPQLAELLAKVLAHAPALADQLGRRPELFEGLFDASSFAMPPPRGRIRRAPRRGDARPALRCRARPGAAPGQRAPLRARRAADRPPARPARSDRRLCAGCRRRADRARPRPPPTSSSRRTAVSRTASWWCSALGRFGGHSLTHASDLDVIYLHTAEQAARPTAQSRSARTIISIASRAGSPRR